MSRLSSTLDRKRRETPWLLLTSIVLFWTSFGFNAWTWGALARVEPVGAQIEHSVRNSSFLGLTYMKAGHWVVDLMGKPELGTAGVAVDYARTLERVAVEPSVASRLILESRESLRARTLSWSQYAPIPLLLLWAFFTVRRPRTRRTFNRSI